MMAKRRRSETSFTTSIVVGSGDYGQATVEDAPGYKCVPIRRRRRGLLFASLHFTDSTMQLAEERFVALPFHPQWLAIAPPAPISSEVLTSGLYYAAGDDDMLHAIDGSSFQVESSMDAVGGSAHVELHGGAKWALCANYGTGVLSVLPLCAAEATLEKTAGRVEHVSSGYHTRTIDPPTDSKQPWPLDGLDPSLADRQEACHPHQIILAHGHSVLKDEPLTWALCCDLGADRVWTYEFDARRGALIGAVSSARHLKLPAGSGPRHLVLLGEGENGQPCAGQRELLVAISCELSGEIVLCQFDTEEGRWTVLSAVDAMVGSGLTCSRSHHSGLSHIAAARSMRYDTIIYVASRTDNALVAFRLERTRSTDSAGGVSTLTFVQRVSTMGVCPRHFAIVNRPSKPSVAAGGSSGGGGEEPAALVVGNQDSQTLVAYRIEPSDGTLREGAVELRVLGVCPSCIVCRPPTRVGLMR